MYKKPLQIRRFFNPFIQKRHRAGQLLVLISAVLLVTTSCADQSNDSPAQAQESSPNTVTLKTNLGDIKLELDAEKAPLTVENFLSYARDGHYDGTIFHRVIQQFMIQGGGFEPGMRKKNTRPPIPNEANNGLLNEPYTIAMARTNSPHSATAQFFINTKSNTSLNQPAEEGRGWGYAVFGKVVTGQDVVDAIEKVSTTTRAGHRDVPVDDVVIESVVIGE